MPLMIVTVMNYVVWRPLAVEGSGNQSVHEDSAASYNYDLVLRFSGDSCVRHLRLKDIDKHGSYPSPATRFVVWHFGDLLPYFGILAGGLVVVFGRVRY